MYKQSSFYLFWLCLRRLLSFFFFCFATRPQPNLGTVLYLVCISSLLIGSITCSNLRNLNRMPLTCHEHLKNITIQLESYVLLLSCIILGYRSNTYALSPWYLFGILYGLLSLIYYVYRMIVQEMLITLRTREAFMDRSILEILFFLFLRTRQFAILCHRPFLPC